MGVSRSEQFVARVVAILAKERRRQGMSHDRLAAAAGVHRSTVSRVESGRISATLVVLHSMCSALGLQFSAVTEEAEQGAKSSSKSKV